MGGLCFVDEPARIVVFLMVSLQKHKKGVPSYSDTQ